MRRAADARDPHSAWPAPGMLVEDSKGECNLGQHEVNFRYAGGAADGRRPRRSTSNGAKEIAFQHGKALTFMPKYDEREGNSCHIHLSLWEGGESLFPEPRRARHDASCSGSFIAGLRAPHARADAAASRPTSTPTSASCAARSRRPRSSGATTTAPARCASSVTATGMRVESRVAGGDVNPYLAFAALLAAGLAGIDGAYELGAACDGLRLRRPRRAARALDAARGARAVRRLGAGARGARRRGHRPLPERRARWSSTRSTPPSPTGSCAAPSSACEPAADRHQRVPHARALDALGRCAAHGHPAGLRRGRARAGGVPILLPPTSDGAQRSGRGARRHRRPDPHRRARSRPGAVRRRARGGHATSRRRSGACATRSSSRCCARRAAVTCPCSASAAASSS